MLVGSGGSHPTGNEISRTLFESKSILTGNDVIKNDVMPMESHKNAESARTLLFKMATPAAACDTLNERKYVDRSDSDILFNSSSVDCDLLNSRKCTEPAENILPFVCKCSNDSPPVVPVCGGGENVSAVVNNNIVSSDVCGDSNVFPVNSKSPCTAVSENCTVNHSCNCPLRIVVDRCSCSCCCGGVCITGNVGILGSRFQENLRDKIETGISDTKLVEKGSSTVVNYGAGQCKYSEPGEMGSLLCGNVSCKTNLPAGSSQKNIVKLIGEKPLVKFDIDSKPCEGLWDTGSMVSLVSSEWLGNNFLNKVFFLFMILCSIMKPSHCVQQITLN